MTWNEFCYWQTFLRLEQDGDFQTEPKPQTMDEQLTFMRSIG